MTRSLTPNPGRSRWASGRKTVLVAEDDAAIARMLERALGVHYDVVVVADGPAALEAAARVEPDLLVLDVAMPGCDGFDVAERVRRFPRLGAVPVLFVTAQVTAQANLRSIELGAASFIAKPFRLVEVLERAREALGDLL